MAGEDAGFDGAEFRDAIRFAMTMGMPETPDELVFRWKPRRGYPIQDPAGEPYNWTETPSSSVTITDLPLTVAYEYVTANAARGSENTSLGEQRLERLVITMLDEERATMLEHSNGVLPDQVEVDGTVFDLDTDAPAVALFDVNVYTFYATLVST